jgi:hypothetical protein
MIRDPFRHMEVRILKGQLKGYIGTVIGTRWRADGSIWVDLNVFAQPTGYKLALDVVDVAGRL